jgi:hypothetical protein
LNPGLDDLFPFILPERNGLVAVFAGYFDESVRDQGGEPICVGGFLFKPADYKKFKRRWNKYVLWLRGRQFAHFHMTDLCAGRKEYEGLNITDRLVILNNAVDAVKTFAYMGIGVHFQQAEFESKAPKDWPERFGSIYTAACQMCLQTTGYWLARGESQMNVAYVFEQGHKYHNEADKLLTAIGQHDGARKRFRYHVHLFEYKIESQDFRRPTCMRGLLRRRRLVMARWHRPFGRLFGLSCD